MPEGAGTAPGHVVVEDTPPDHSGPQRESMRGGRIDGSTSVGRSTPEPHTAAERRNGIRRPRRAAGRRIRRGRWLSFIRSSKPPASSYALPMTSRVEVFVRSGHTIDLALEDGQDRIFANALHEAWSSPDPIGYKHLTLGENAVILASEVVGYRLHGPIRTDSAI